MDVVRGVARGLRDGGCGGDVLAGKCAFSRLFLYLLSNTPFTLQDNLLTPLYKPPKIKIILPFMIQ